MTDPIILNNRTKLASITYYLDADENPTHITLEVYQECPKCSTHMPALKGGKHSRCSNCGWRDDCC